MKRRASNEFDSLDLLLDTICDTFGGVLFVAVLVALLASRLSNSTSVQNVHAVRMDGAPTDATSLANREAELQSLSRAMQEQRDTLTSLHIQQPQEQLQQILELRRELNDLTEHRAEHVQRIVKSQQETLQLEQSQQTVGLGLLVARKEETSLRQRLENEKSNRTRTITLPMLRQTSKREFPLVVRFGRIYFPFVAENSLDTRKSNLSDFVILDSDGPVIKATPKPYSGIPLDGSTESIDRFQNLIRSIDKRSAYLSIGVWEDSFEQFQNVKELIVKLGFEYRLVPVAAGEFIQEAPIKDTLVQ